MDLLCHGERSAAISWKYDKKEQAFFGSSFLSHGDKLDCFVIAGLTGIFLTLETGPLFY